MLARNGSSSPQADLERVHVREEVQDVDLALDPEGGALHAACRAEVGVPVDSALRMRAHGGTHRPAMYRCMNPDPNAPTLA